MAVEFVFYLTNKTTFNSVLVLDVHDRRHISTLNFRHGPGPIQSTLSQIS